MNACCISHRNECEHNFEQVDTFLGIVSQENEQSFPAFISVTSEDLSSSVHNVRIPVACLHHENKVLASMVMRRIKK